MIRRLSRLARCLKVGTLTDSLSEFDAEHSYG
jgi:hypothetical protein